MIPAKAILLSLPVALLGVAGVVETTRRIEGFQVELAALDARGRAEGASFVRTLKGRHAERELQLLDERRSLAMSLADARRNRLLSFVVLGFSALVLGGVTVLARLAREIEEDRRWVESHHRPDRS